MSSLDISFRQNLQSFVNAVNTPQTATVPAEKQYDKLKEIFDNKGLAIFLLTKQTHNNLHQASAAPGQQKQIVNLDVRPLDLRKFKTDNDFNRLDRLIVFNKADNTVAFVEMAGEQSATFENVEITLNLKTPDKSSGEDQIITNIQAKKLTQEDFDALNQVVSSVMKNLQVPTIDDPSALLDAGEIKAVIQTRGGRSKESKNTSESSESEEKDLPASERETFVDAAEKIQKELSELARQEHELEKAGEKRHEEFIRYKNKVDLEKDRNRSRIAENALKAGTQKKRRKVQGL